MATPIDYNRIDQIIQKNIQQFNKQGVLTVRPGYKITGGWITDKPAIVVTVDRKLDGLPDSEKLPVEIEDIPTDVREATGMQRLRASDPAAYALARSHARSEWREPDWPSEYSLPDGEPITHTSVDHPQHTPAAHTPADPTRANFPSSTPTKPPIAYTPAATPLDSVTGSFTILCHASPDAGFGVLQSFLEDVEEELVIAMYDFNSAEILQEVIQAIIPSDIRFQMVLDHPPTEPGANQTDVQARQAILELEKDNAAINWALSGNNPAIKKWIFPVAYHIKVAVRDRSSIWLSSGNFNLSNQPDLAAGDPSKGSLEYADRDWHLVIENEQLAALFREYIQHDFMVAQPYQAEIDQVLNDQVNAAMQKLAAESSKSSLTVQPSGIMDPANFLDPVIFEDLDLTIQPLLTPDPGQHTTLYVDHVLALIQSATRRLYMQTQYVQPSDIPEDKDFQLLIQAFSDARKRGVDVRLITSQYENTPQWIEKLKVFDLDQVLRIQERVHNKGIVVDSTTVLVSSMNWSPNGILRNRDAGVIIRHAGIAAYYESLFLCDWNNYATEKVVDISHPV